MKKFFKSLSVICLALLIICPLALVGCDKNYTINISIASGCEEYGEVYKKGSESQKVLGKNAVDKGDKFEYHIAPDSGYEISKIVIDGKEFTEAYDKNGAYLSFENIKKNHSVVITFIAKKYTVEFHCKVSAGVYAKYDGLDALLVNRDAEINLNENKYGGQNNTLWFMQYQDVNGQPVIKYLYNKSAEVSDPVPAGYSSNILRVRSNIILYCDLTADQLTARLSGFAA